jgi:hypothetical protein
VATGPGSAKLGVGQADDGRQVLRVVLEYRLRQALGLGVVEVCIEDIGDL